MKSPPSTSAMDVAVVVCPQPELPEAGLLCIQVAGLPLLIRALLTAQQAGIERFVVVASHPQRAGLDAMIEGEIRLRGRVRWIEPTESLVSLPACSLVLLPSVILVARALRDWLIGAAQGGMVAAPDDAGSSPLVVPAALLSQCIEAIRQGQLGLKGFLERVHKDGRLVRIPWEGIRGWPIRSAEEVSAVEQAMLQAVRSPDDGPIVDRFVNRTCSVLLTRRLLRSRVTPNQITVASLLIGLLGAWLLGNGGTTASLGGLALFQFAVILDHVDGEIARLKFLYSRLGKWLDNFSDHTVDLAVIGFLAWRVADERTAVNLALLGVAAAVGVTGAFLVVFWWSSSGGSREVRATEPAQLLARLLSCLANRDAFSLGLWVTTLIDRPMWFLWTLAFGANVYWIAWLLTYGIPRKPAIVVPRPAA